jgi:ADP-ribose pyrophosphatase YjhB (NUDIX family)
VSYPGELLARGPWEPGSVSASWRSEPFDVGPHETAAADLLIERLRARGSPAHDGLAARLVAFRADDGHLSLELQPARWALRLLNTDEAASVSALCVVRAADGCWLAGHRASWLASWAGRWALGAGGAVEVDENPADTLARELREEWSVAPERLSVEALVRTPSGMVLLIGQAWLAAGTEVVPDHEHDQYAWWPREVDDWPPDADAPLRRVGQLLAG